MSCSNQFASILCRVIFIFALFLSACGGNSASPAPPPDTPSESDSQVEIVEIEPLALDEAQPPIYLSIPEIGLEAKVVPMGWRVTSRESATDQVERTTVWDVPYSDAGWHITSAGAGANGNVIISGHQIVGEAVFLPLALGEAEVGQRIYLTDELEQTFVYEIVAVAEPIPQLGATDEDVADAQNYVEPAEQAILTLITGWPDFSTTHYLFITAELVGQSAGE